jgi:hypothetical protein
MIRSRGRGYSSACLSGEDSNNAEWVMVESLEIAQQDGVFVYVATSQ